MVAENETEASTSPTEARRPRVEYRVERLPFGDNPASPSHLTDTLERLNELGRQGWLVVSIDLTDPVAQHPGLCRCREPRLPVLMQREVEE